MTQILVTGGAGYIGSHMCVELLQADHQVVALDNLSNSSEEALRRVEQLTQKPLAFVRADLRDAHALKRVFENHTFGAVIHFAGLKAVGESVEQPERYYDNNISGSLRLVECMTQFDVKKLVFSSSATVYGTPEANPIDENFPTGPINPYGRSKLFVEQMLRDIADSDPTWRISLLRYFNPVGAHASGEIGEDPRGIPNNLMPYISQVAAGRRPHLNVFGDDYPTPDGTGIRDYIHVVDLVRGHLDALRYLELNPGAHVHNLGTGRGYSVLEVVKAFEMVSGKKIPYCVTARRPGDAAESYANPILAESDLGWRAKHDLLSMCEDTWRWQASYPDGYR